MDAKIKSSYSPDGVYGVGISSTHFPTMEFLRKQIYDLVKKPTPRQELDDYEAFYQECKLMAMKYDIVVLVGNQKFSRNGMRPSEVQALKEEWKMDILRNFDGSPETPLE